VPSRLQVLASKTIYDGKVVKLKIDHVIEPGGVEAVREVVYHSGSIVILPILSDDRIVLVRQYRYATRQRMWELVAGGMERGETIPQSARRELLEETGYRARAIKPLLDFYPSPGILSERMFLVEARDLAASKARPEEDENIEIGRFTRHELRGMIRAGKIRDGKTLVGLLWLFSQGLSSV
jgi:ADP-ribose pyrophosphatase